VHEELQKKARYGAPRTAEKKHDMVHEKRQTRARARRNKQNMSWVSWVLQEMPNNITDFCFKWCYKS
jgi:hypothetical protein